MDWIKDKKKFAKEIIPFYNSNPVAIADLCDGLLDKSGSLLGYIREYASTDKGE